MKRILTVLLMLCLMTLTGCEKNYKNKLTQLDKYVFEVDEYKELDYEAANAFYAKTNDNWGVVVVPQSVR